MDWGSWPGSTNSILAQAGVICRVQPKPMSEDIEAFTSAGTVTFDGKDDFPTSREIHSVLRLRPKPGMLNVYVVRRMKDTIGT